MSFVRLSRAFNEAAKYSTVGLFNTLLGVSIIYMAKWTFGLGDIPANLLGYSICIVIGFLINTLWTFGGTFRLSVRRFFIYFFIAGIAYFSNLMIVVYALSASFIPREAAQLLGVPAFTLTSFILNKLILFRHDASIRRRAVVDSVRVERLAPKNFPR